MIQPISLSHLLLDTFIFRIRIGKQQHHHYLHIHQFHQLPTRSSATKLTIDLSHIHGLGSVDKNSEAAANTAAEGYSSDAGLIFCSWKMDIEMEIMKMNMIINQQYD